jgi:hypothetical protein
MTTENTFRIVVWEIETDPEFAGCQSVRDIMEFDLDERDFRLDGRINARAKKLFRNYTECHAAENVCMTLERGPFGL